MAPYTLNYRIDGSWRTTGAETAFYKQWELLSAVLKPGDVVMMPMTETDTRMDIAAVTGSQNGRGPICPRRSRLPRSNGFG